MLAAATESVTFAISPYWPIAVGFFGLGTGYFIWGGQALFKFPAQSPEVDKTMGMWGFWMPGFCQFLTGVLLFVGLTWFDVFGNAAPLYMAAVAFTLYGIHWFAMAHRRFIQSSASMDGWMAIPYAFVSILGIFVFLKAHDVPVAIVFILLTLIYLTEIPTRFRSWQGGARLVGLWQFLNGIWLMYCTWAITVNLALGYKVWI
jgi:hypothetical protein